ncbi:Protein kinase domain-containing protein [Heracleum sosnowskyi]|uniref:Protein kinase domain-containing protein n=1 Tax=Heracleum sosnowskyi TaxID=360622 RepID=A0AAD8I9N0_9APIA|nr:Protein kinase domain-containing protein [Heracleum sosnowskyi]
MQLEQVIQCILFSTVASLNYLLELYKSCFRTEETSVNAASCAGLFLFYQEIKVLQQLDHPNIVQYLGSDIIEDRFCIYLEYVHPGSINNYVREHYRSVTESVVHSFTRHILTGLAYLHSTNTIHR